MTVQFSSDQTLDRLGRRGDIRDDSAEIFFQYFLQKAIVSSSGIGRDVHSVMLWCGGFFLACEDHRCCTPYAGVTHALQRTLKDGFGKAFWQVTVRKRRVNVAEC